MEISGKFHFRFELLSILWISWRPCLACRVQFAREKIVLSRTVHPSIQWPVVLQQTFCGV